MDKLISFYFLTNMKFDLASDTVKIIFILAGFMAVCPAGNLGFGLWALFVFLWRAPYSLIKHKFLTEEDFEDI